MHYCTLEVADHAVDPAYWTDACGQACAAALQSVQESPILFTAQLLTENEDFI